MNKPQNSVLDESLSDSKNVRQVKALYRALKSKDQALIHQLLVDEPVWDVAPGFPNGTIYRGIAEIFGGFYQKLFACVHSFGAFPDSFVDGGDTVVALGHYQVIKTEGRLPISVRFSHAWCINEQGRIKGVWQVADSAQLLNS